jgi:AMP nucleosidase
MGRGRPMPNAMADGISAVNFGMGSANAATVMDLLSARVPKAVLLSPVDIQVNMCAAF